MSMPARRIRTSHRGFAGRPQRRKLVWATRAVSNQTVTTGSKINQDLLSNLEVAGSSVLGATVMRIHMDLILNWTTTDASLGVTYGFIVDSAPTVTNLDANADFGDDWMLLRTQTPALSDNSTTIGTNIAGGRVIDLRSKRKIEELGERLFFCLTNEGSGSVGVGYLCRTLIALP